MKFNLLNLHNPAIDKKPRSWITLNGKNLAKIINHLINDICKTEQISKYQLSIRISKIIDCNVDTVCKRLYQSKGYDWYPIPLIESVLVLWKNICKNEVRDVIKTINDETQFLKTGRSYIYKAVKKVSPSAARLCGAIVADGHITKDRNAKIIIIDNYQRAVVKCARWFKEVFGFLPYVKKSKAFDAWYFRISSKLAARMLNVFFEIPAGRKSSVVKEPKCIKESQYRMDFVKGVLLMDGCVETDNIISFGTTSGRLAKDVFEILKQNNFAVKFSYKPSNKIFMIKTGVLNKEEAEKWISVFGRDTEKGEKLYEMNYGFSGKARTLKDAIDAFDCFYSYGNSYKISFKEVIFAIKELRKSSKKTLAVKLNIEISTLYKYLWLLEKAKIVKVKRTYHGSHIENKYTYNPNIKDWIVPSMS